MKNIVKLILLFVIIGFVACSSNDDSGCTETTWYQDLDGDGLGNPDVSQNACEQPEDYVTNNSDTDDYL